MKAILVVSTIEAICPKCGSDLYDSASGSLSFIAVELPQCLDCKRTIEVALPKTIERLQRGERIQ